MSKQTLEAVYEKGVFRPLAPRHIAIPEGQRVQIMVETEESAEAVLALALEVYRGLSEEEIDEIEQIALDRRAFFAEPADCL